METGVKTTTVCSTALNMQVLLVPGELFVVYEYVAAGSYIKAWVNDVTSGEAG